MACDWLKRLLGGPRSTTPDSARGHEATDRVMSDVLVLQSRIEHLNTFSQACGEAGLEGDLKEAALSAHAFATRCLALINARGDINARGKLEEVTQAVRAQHEVVTSNLMDLAISANSAGVNLQTAAREVYEIVNDLMETMELARD